MAYHLLTGLWTHLTRKEEFNVVILGLDNAGKTTFLERIKSEFNDAPAPDPSKIAPTVGQNIGRISMSSSHLQFWDVGGQRDFRALWPKYYADSHAVVYLIDSSDAARLEEAFDVFEGMAVDRRVQGVPMLVLANKQDSETAERVEEIKEAFNRHVDKLNVSESAVLPVSALHGSGIREAIDWLFIRVQNSRRMQAKGPS